MAKDFGQFDPRVVQGDQALARGDHATAMQCYRAAADAGNAVGQHNVAALYQDGIGVAVNYTEARKWFGRAAAQGVPQSQLGIGLIYYHGQGVTPDTGRAIEWISQAAEQGLAAAEHALGAIYDNGRGIARDRVRAAHWYRLAASKGHPPAQQALARMGEQSEARRILDEIEKDPDAVVIRLGSDSRSAARASSPAKAAAAEPPPHTPLGWVIFCPIPGALSGLLITAILSGLLGWLFGFEMPTEGYWVGAAVFAIWFFVGNLKAYRREHG